MKLLIAILLVHGTPVSALWYVAVITTWALIEVWKIEWNDDQHTPIGMP